MQLTGQIDRLVDLGDEVLIVDYKTNRPPPTNVGQVAAAYLFQLAAYRLALARNLSRARHYALRCYGPTGRDSWRSRTCCSTNTRPDSGIST